MSQHTAQHGGTSTAETAAPPIKLDPEAIYDHRRLAAALGVSRQTLWRWRGEGRRRFPRPARVGCRSLWRGHVINAWLDNRLQEEMA